VKTFTIDEAIADRRLFAPALEPIETWATWRVVLKSAFGLPLGAEELAVFRRVAGERSPPKRRVKELWAVCARRSGKSRMAALAGTYLSCFLPRKLAPGEVGEVTIVSATQAQAAVVHRYAVGFLRASPVLAREIEAVTASEVRLRGGVVLSVRSGNYRFVRGRTLLSAIMDECAFLRDESSAVPDLELYRALLPALATTDGMLIGISTPYRKQGLLYQKHRDFFGVDDPDVLVVAGDSRTFNPTLDQGVVERARASDPEGARSEWDAEFRSDISAFLDDATIDRAIDHGRPAELPPRLGIYYRMWVDASGGRHDHYTCCVAHREPGEDGGYVVDALRGAAPPFDPETVTREFAELAKQYRIGGVTGDNFAQEWVASTWRKNGLVYVQSERPRSVLYLETLPLWARGLVSIPDHKRLVMELRRLERRAHRSGRDTVDHGRSGSDDYSNVVCGSLTLLATYLGGYDTDFRRWIGGGKGEKVETVAEAQERRDREYRDGLAAHLRSCGIPGV
jgi:hypothetical protein